MLPTLACSLTLMMHAKNVEAAQPGQGAAVRTQSQGDIPHNCSSTYRYSHLTNSEGLGSQLHRLLTLYALHGVGNRAFDLETYLQGPVKVAHITQAAPLDARHITRPTEADDVRAFILSVVRTAADAISIARLPAPERILTFYELGPSMGKCVSPNTTILVTSLAGLMYRELHSYERQEHGALIRRNMRAFVIALRSHLLARALPEDAVVVHLRLGDMARKYPDEMHRYAAEVPRIIRALRSTLHHAGPLFVHSDSPENATSFLGGVPHTLMPADTPVLRVLADMAHAHTLVISRSTLGMLSFWAGSQQLVISQMGRSMEKRMRFTESFLAGNIEGPARRRIMSSVALLSQSSLEVGSPTQTHT